MNYLAAVWFVLFFAVSGAVCAQDPPDMDEILNLYNSDNKDQA